MNRLLLIDDEPSIVRVLSISLRADGYDVLTAGSGPEGLATFEREKPEIIITDIKMPGMDGIKVLEKIKALEPDAEVIIITGHGDIDNAIESLKLGASDFINKPIRNDALTIALQRAKDKLDIKKKLKEYTMNLEREVENATHTLRRQSNFLSKLIKSSNDGIVATDKDFTIVIFNPGAERIFGLAADEVIGHRTLADLKLPSDLAARLNNARDRSAGKDEMLWQETTVTAKNGTLIPVRFSGTHLYEENRMMGSVVFFQDLREIKRLEMELLRSERLAAVGQTVAGLAHGIKNILHGLKGGSYLVDLGLQKNDTARLRNGWDMIKRNIGRTSDLVMDLLSYSKEREPEYEPCSPNEIAGDVCALLAEKAEENKIEILKDFDPSIPEVLMDPIEIHEVLLNLMSNAIDACLFDEDTTKNWQVRLKTVRENDAFIRFEVTDNGVGMSAEVQQKLFTSFFSTKGHRGTGLGLMVTRKIVEAHHGSIAVASQLAKGTTFTVLIPYRAVGNENR
jgi:two-component system, NtrC family, sensor kinase